MPTKPVFKGTDIIPLVEDNVEDDHDADHDIEGYKGCHWWELAFVVDNHEDEEDENSGHKIHQHIQHQDQDVKNSQSFFFIFVHFNCFYINYNVI